MIFRGFPLLFFSIWKLCCFVIWLGVGTNLCYWLRLFCTLLDYSEAISLVWTSRSFYPWFEEFSTLKILVPLFVLLVIYYCCSLIIAPHRFLQVRGNYIRCILWYHLLGLRRGSVPMWLKGLTLEGEIVRNPSVILSPTLARNEKVEHYIRIKTHKPIALRFWVESGVNALCGWAQVSLVLYLPSDTPSLKT